MDVAIPLVLVVATIFVPTLCAILLDITEKRRYALALLGLIGIAFLPLTLQANAVVWSTAYAVGSGTTTAIVASRSRPKLAPLAAGLAVSLTIVTAALAWVSTLAR
ncbi:MAG: hypothetical protein WDA16_12065 [Candidatus Thermoplasmatota archaeon]